MVSFPYYSHIFRDSYGSGMGIAWEAYHKGVPLLGVPENPIHLLREASWWPVFAAPSKSPFKPPNMGRKIIRTRIS